MPDQPGKGPPSSAPLSVEDADRLAESFTAFWDDDGMSSPVAAPAPIAAAPAGAAPALAAPAAPVAAAPGSTTAPMPAVAPVPAFRPIAAFPPLGSPLSAAVKPAPVPASPEPARKPNLKQTLLGIAPLTPVQPATHPPLAGPAPIVAPAEPIAPPPPPPPIAAPPAVAGAPAGAAARPPVHNKTLLGFSGPATATPPLGSSPIAAATLAAAPPATPIAAAPVAAPPPTAPTAEDPAVAPKVDPTSTPLSAPTQSSPEVPGYAIAYTPKDGPATPAVVIAPEAQSSPENKRPLSMTVPSRVRAASVIEAPLPQPVSSSLDDFNPYANRGKGKIIALALGGIALVAAGIAGSRFLGGEPGASSDSTAQPAVTAPAVVPATTPEPPAAEPTPEAKPDAERVTTAAPAAVPAPERTEPTPARVSTHAAAPARPKSEPAATRPVTRAPAATPAEPSPAAPKPSKGVIVRDAPF